MNVKILVKKDLGEYKKGSIITVKAFDDGQPKPIYWRNRLKDSQFDGCCELVKEKKEKKITAKPEKKEKQMESVNEN